MAFLTAALFAAAAMAAASAPASIEVAVDARAASLQVDAAGNAQVRWTAADGTQRSLLVSRDGSLRYGGLNSSDVSHAAAGVSIPWTVVVRQTPDGRFYALQAWRRLVHGPVELRFSRWEGAPTKLTLRTVCCKWGHENVVGSASFHGRPIYGYKATRQGNPLDPYGRNVYLDSYRGGRWERMMGILTNRPSGSFSLWIRPEWAGGGYRGTIPGPNWGWTLGPDALAQAGSSQSRPAPAQAAAGVLAKTAGHPTGKHASAPAQNAVTAVTGRAAGASASAGARSAVQVTLSATPDPATVGSPLTYTATVINTGPDASKPVTLYFMMSALPADPITHAPAEPAFVSATVAGARCQNAGKVFVCPLGSLPSGRAVTARFVVLPKLPTLYPAQFAAQAYTHLEGEAYSANASAVRQTSVHA